MKGLRWVASVALLSLCITLRAYPQQLTPAWIEVGEDGSSLARIVVTMPADCPAITINGATQPMAERTPVPQGFRPVCQAAIPKGARSVRVGGLALVLPKVDPSHIVAFGD